MRSQSHTDPKVARRYSSDLLAWPEAEEWEVDALHIDRLGDVALADVPQDVVVEGVSDVRLQGVDGTLAGGLGLQDEAHKSNLHPSSAQKSPGNPPDLSDTRLEIFVGTALAGTAHDI